MGWRGHRVGVSAIVLTAALAAVAVIALTRSSTSSSSIVAAGPGCKFDARGPLPADIGQPVDRVVAGAKQVVRRSAADRSSALSRVLGGSSYAYGQSGYMSNGADPTHRHPFALIGALVEVRLDRPHAVDATVPEWAPAWPRSSRNYRYSRRLGYVPYRARLRSSDVVSSVMVSVDMRTRTVIAIQPGLSSAATLEPLPGHCPLPAQPGTSERD